MKVLVVSQYFFPENFRINEIVQTLVDKGIDVDVLTGKPNYPEGVFLELLFIRGVWAAVWALVAAS
jgi:phosphatidylserine/phosphatidylglycerophosphate/cardiolipin synthase-like enzyme